MKNISKELDKRNAVMCTTPDCGQVFILEGGEIRAGRICPVCGEESLSWVEKKEDMEEIKEEPEAELLIDITQEMAHKNQLICHTCYHIFKTENEGISWAATTQVCPNCGKEASSMDGIRWVKL